MELNVSQNPAVVLAISLVVAHLLADFVFQTGRARNETGRLTGFATHAVVTAATSYLLAADWSAWIIPLAIGLSHAIFDGLERYAATKSRRGIGPWLIDQAAHLFVIFALAFVWAPAGDYANALVTRFGAGYLTGLLVVGGFSLTVWVGGVVIGMLVEPYLAELESSGDSGFKQGLARGGQMIGRLERGLIFFFVLVNKPEAVAILVAAKSIFRFGELSKNRKEAEYILIGTLMSFGWGLLAAWIVRWLMENL